MFERGREAYVHIPFVKLAEPGQSCGQNGPDVA